MAQGIEELVHPSWAPALAPLAPQVAAMEVVNLTRMLPTLQVNLDGGGSAKFDMVADRTHVYLAHSDGPGLYRGSFSEAPRQLVSGDVWSIAVTNKYVYFDHHHRQIKIADRACEPLRQLLLAELDETARHRALGRRAGPVRRRHRLLGTGIAPRRHARGDGGHRGRIQRVAAGGPQEAWQRQFAFDRRAGSRSAHCNALAAEHDLTGGAAATHGTPCSVGHSLGPAQRDAVGFHHRAQHLLAGFDAQAQECVAHVAQNTLHGQRDLNLRSRHHPQRGLRVRLHLGGSFGCL